MRRKNIIIYISVFLVLSLTKQQHTIYAQETWFNNEPVGMSQVPLDNIFIFKTFAMPTNNSNLTQMVFYAKIANDLLQFILKDTTYIAQYELTISIKNQNGETIVEKIKKREIKAAHFQETNSRDRFTMEQFDFFLSPGEYDLFIEILDNDTKIPIRKKEKIILPDFHSKPFAVTDILFFHSTDENVPFPDFPAIYSRQDSTILAKFYIFSFDSLYNISIKHKISNKETQPVALDSFDIHLNSKITPITIKLNNQLDFGQYTLSIDLSNDITKTTIESPFYIRWTTHSTLLPNLNDVIETLKYIMDPTQWKELKDQPKKEQEKIIDTFWKERDPIPATEKNELEEEYYRRITFSNQYFSNWQEETEGWQTDRGRIFIIYGKPSLVENPADATDQFSRYEIWIYSHLKKRFVFFDSHGTGDYRLIAEE
ncbi:GWxTD domain-containing protein [bacterium]|nr:GWxTD domain-containing protein [bacterium]